MNEQLKNHFTTFLRIVQILKSKSAAKRYLGKCIYTVITGNNDYINNYFMPNFYPTSWLYNPQQFADVLVKQYSEQLKVSNSNSQKCRMFSFSVVFPAFFSMIYSVFNFVNNVYWFSTKCIRLYTPLEQEKWPYSVLGRLGKRQRWS